MVGGARNGGGEGGERETERKLSDAAELAWGVERKTDPSQAPLGAFDYCISPALCRKNGGWIGPGS